MNMGSVTRNVQNWIETSEKAFHCYRFEQLLILTT